jgi:hypothetical protein
MHKNIDTSLYRESRNNVKNQLNFCKITQWNTTHLLQYFFHE